MAYSHATYFCQEHGGVIAKITSMEEFIEIKAYLS